MESETKERLIDQAHHKITWRGKLCSVGGYANEYATVTTSKPGFYHCTWETIQRAIESGTLDNENVWFASHGWLGCEVE